MTMIKRLAASIREYKRDTILTPLLMIGEVVCECVIPLYTAQLVNSIQAGCTRDVIFYYGLRLLGLALLSLCFGMAAGWFCAAASTGFAKNLRHDLFYRVQNFSFANIDQFSTSSLVTRLTTDVSNVQMAFMMIIRTAVRAPLMLIFSVIMSIKVGKELAFVFAAAIPLLSFGLLLMAKFAMPLFKAVFKKYDRLNNSVQENVQAMRVVKSFVREDYETKKFSAASDDVRKDFLKAEKILATNTPLMQFCVYMSRILICYFAAKLIVQSGGTYLNVGSLTSMITYSMSILMSLMMLSMIFVMVTMASASAKRIAEVLDTETDLKNPASPLREVPNGAVDFDHVSFKYSAKAERNALDDIDLHIPSGATVGVIGSTGSSSSSPASTTRPKAASAWAAMTCASTTLRRCGIRWPWCCRRTCSSPARSKKISAGAIRTRPTRISSASAASRRRTTLSGPSRTGMTPILNRAARTSPAGRSSGCASRGRC